MEIYDALIAQTTALFSVPCEVLAACFVLAEETKNKHAPLSDALIAAELYKDLNGLLKDGVLLLDSPTSMQELLFGLASFHP